MDYNPESRPNTPMSHKVVYAHTILKFTLSYANTWHEDPHRFLRNPAQADVNTSPKARHQCD